MATLGFIGLGLMGRPMAKNLIKGGHKVVVYNRSPEKMEELVQMGALAASGAADVGERCEIIFTCVPADADVEAVVDECLTTARPGTLFIDHSTIGPATCRRLYEKCRERGCQFLDAPVSGGPWGAEAATLAIMAGGDEPVFARAKPYLAVLGKNIFHVGGSGAGAVAKLVNQLLVGIHTAATAEAFVLATKAGVDPKLMIEIIGSATGDSKQLQRNLRQFTFKGHFEPGFSINNLLKDIRLANELGGQAGVPMELGSYVQQLLEACRSAGLGARDVSGAILLLEEKAGVQVRVPEA